MEGRVAVITGASAGIGRAAAQALLASGAKVAVVGRDRSRLVEATSASAPDHVLPVVADVCDERQVEAAVEAVVGHWGRIDVLVNAAGAFEGDLAADLDLARWTEVLATNLTAPFLMTRACLPSMVAGGGGSIVNVASVASTIAGTGGVAYTASKHGLLGLTRQVAMQYGHQGVRANAICPGTIDTGMTQAPDSERTAAFVARLPAGRRGTAEEVAEVILFLASDRSAYVTGATWTIDGGFTLGHFRGGSTSPTGDDT